MQHFVKSATVPADSPATDSCPADSGRLPAGTQPTDMMPSRMSSSVHRSSVSPVSYTTWHCLLFSCTHTYKIRLQLRLSAGNMMPARASIKVLHAKSAMQFECPHINVSGPWNRDEPCMLSKAKMGQARRQAKETKAATFRCNLLQGAKFLQMHSTLCTKVNRGEINCISP